VGERDLLAPGGSILGDKAELVFSPQEGREGKEGSEVFPGVSDGGGAADHLREAVGEGGREGGREGRKEGEKEGRSGKD
jgi:hypothetical protein